MEKVGLVLSGGGSKGSYEIGVYKALRKLHIKIDIVTGTSIGAVNGMFVTQRDLRGALRFWKKLNFERMYREEDFPKMDDIELRDVYYKYIKAFLTDGGMNVSKLEKMFTNYFKPYSFFTSKIDYGLVTYNLSKRKPIMIKKKDLTKDNAKGYIIASASCYPAYKPYIIENDMYVDGGYYDNLPINLAIELGATKIIAVDLKSVGLKRKISDESVDIIYITPKNKLTSFLVFDEKQSKEGIKYGYNDTMKKFGKLEGNKYTFKKGNLIKNYTKYNDLYEENLNKIFSDKRNKIFNNIFKIPIFKEVIERKTLYKNFNDIVETAGMIFKFEQSNIYNIYAFNRGLLNELSNSLPINVETIIKNIKSKKSIIDSRQVVKFFYNCIIKDERQMIKYIPIFQNEFLTALYIYTVKGLRVTY